MSNQEEMMQLDGINGGGGLISSPDFKIMKNLLSYYSVALGVYIKYPYNFIFRQCAKVVDVH
jgi:hypothetical protein